MKYLLLIYHNPGTRDIWESMTEDQQAEGLEFYKALNEELAASGELIVAESLGNETTRVTVEEGRRMTSDGPFAEVKEQLAGFYLLECESAERAAVIASRIPEAEGALGYVEIRPVMTYSGLEM